MAKLSENDILKKYAKVIDALIPYQHQGRLLEGINKFSAKLPSHVRATIKQEVIRLTALTDATADNSDFASYPVQRFKYFGVDMQLDKVGQKILREESAKYADQYTVGVFESVMNSEHYQSQIKKSQQRKIANAFSVQAQSFSDLDFADDLAVKPRFSVTCTQFDKGKSCAVSALSVSTFKVETSRVPADSNEEQHYEFVFPEVQGLCANGTTVFCVKSSSGFNQANHKFETEFKFVNPTEKDFLKRLSHYLQKMLNRLPLEQEFEVERVIQNLDRDHILANSPWIPLFLSSQGSQVSIESALMSQVNFEFNDGFKTLDKLPGNVRLNSLMPELKKFSETFILRGVFETKYGPTTVCASFRELQTANILAPFINMVNKTQKLTVLQLRLVPITHAPKQLACDIHDLHLRDYPKIGAITYALFCKDVSEQIGTLAVPEDTPNTKFPSVIIDREAPQTLQVLLESSLERRKQTRYRMDKPVQIKTGVLNKVQVTLKDMSINGLKLKLDNAESITKGQAIKVSSAELKISNERYIVVAFDATTKMVHLVAPKESKELKNHIANSIEGNSRFFKTRDLMRYQDNIYRHLWEMSIRLLPFVAILVTQNRHVISRLSTVYASASSRDLFPFKAGDKQIQLHGFFADKDADKPKSKILHQMLSRSQQNSHVIHAINRQDKRIIHIEENDFFYGDVRAQIIDHTSKDNIDICVSQVNAIKCRSHQTQLTPKRLAFLSTISLDLYDKMKDLQKMYTHVIYITNMSSLHGAFLSSGITHSAKQH